jgi:hypothetical protein
MVGALFVALGSVAAFAIPRRKRSIELEYAPEAADGQMVPMRATTD